MRITFLWHMHQPDYRDAITGGFVMPWVRMHAYKGYYDIPHSMRKYNIHGCVNIVPSLIEQIREYTRSGATDRWRICTERDPETMDSADRTFIVRNFFMLHHERLVKPSPRYSELLEKRNSAASSRSAAAAFSDNDIRDLQVLFNLKWFGFTAREHFPELVALDRRDRDFTAEDVKTVIDIQDTILSSIIPLYRSCAEEGIIELSFTPFHHPIYPLLHNSDIGARPAPDTPLPRRFSYPDDAWWHLTAGKSYAENTWGCRCEGMWPAEGAVSPELVSAAAASGVRWIATDEEVLFRTTGQNNRGTLYTPHQLQTAAGELNIFFRDRHLSDLIGFSFSRMSPEVATEEFITEARRKAALCDNPREAVIPVILDGENAWEGYPDNGGPFIRALFSRLRDDAAVTTETFSAVCKQCGDTAPVLPTIHSGSWIHADFRVWIGNDDDNRAWNILKTVREYAGQRLHDTQRTDEECRQVMQYIHRAEGSDWFWWFGDMFSTENDHLFDMLFRHNLATVYRILGEPVPSFLTTPISRCVVDHEHNSAGGTMYNGSGTSEE